MFVFFKPSIDTTVSSTVSGYSSAKPLADTTVSSTVSGDSSVIHKKTSAMSSPVVSVTKLARIKSMPCLFIVNPPLGLTDLLMSSLCINFNCRKVYLSLPTALLIILLIRVSIIQVMTMWR